MNYELIRTIVEEEVIKALSSAKSTVRVRRPVVSEAMIVAAWRRGSKSLPITPGAIITPAARERAKALGLAIDEIKVPAASPEVGPVVEAVMAAVVAQISGRPTFMRASATNRKVLITAKDIELCRFNTKVLTVGTRTRITPLARELAERYGVKIVQA